MKLSSLKAYLAPAFAISVRRLSAAQLAEEIVLPGQRVAEPRRKIDGDPGRHLTDEPEREVVWRRSSRVHLSGSDDVEDSEVAMEHGGRLREELVASFEQRAVLHRVVEIVVEVQRVGVAEVELERAAAWTKRQSRHASVCPLLEANLVGAIGSHFLDVRGRSDERVRDVKPTTLAFEPRREVQGRVRADVGPPVLVGARAHLEEVVDAGVGAETQPNRRARHLDRDPRTDEHSSVGIRSPSGVRFGSSRDTFESKATPSVSSACIRDFSPIGNPVVAPVSPCAKAGAAYAVRATAKRKVDARITVRSRSAESPGPGPRVAARSDPARARPHRSRR